MREQYYKDRLHVGRWRVTRWHTMTSNPAITGAGHMTNYISFTNIDITS